MKRIAILSILLSFSTVSLANEPSPNPTDVPQFELSGPAIITDGDTLSIGSQVVRIDGVDAPEDAQDCGKADGGRWTCGKAATDALRKLAAGGVQCRGREFDAYRRLIANCQSGEVDLGLELVINGLAMAYRKYSERYVSEEQQARRDGRGIWQGPFVEPWTWRRDAWQNAGNEAPSPDCPIKGNISSDGTRIYHAPWSRSYQRTRINTAQGERWFCNEAEALDAGWRAPYR